MEWYQYALLAIGVAIILRWLSKRSKRLANAREQEGEEIHRMVAAWAQRNANPMPAKQLNPELKPYLARLCRVHDTCRGFASPDTTTIGKELRDKYGYNGMVEVCDELRCVLGNGPARELEYKWDGIGEWQG